MLGAAAFFVGGAAGVFIVIVGLATHGLGMWGKGKKRKP